MSDNASPQMIKIGDFTNSGQFAFGNGNVQISSTQAAPVVTLAEREALSGLLDNLEKQIAQTAPTGVQAQALERAGELKEAVLASEPDLSTMEYVKGWFVKNLPGLAGTVTGIVIHPIVGKLVEAAGEALAAEFRRRFLGG